MAILSKEEFFNELHTRIGTDTSDEALTFIENMTDTFNDLESRANGDGVDWERKAHEIDEAWKAKYRHRFFHGCDSGYPNDKGEADGNTAREDVRVEDLFE